MKEQKEIFKKLFAVTCLILILLPFLVTFSQALTDLFDKFTPYSWLQKSVVPFEAKLVVTLLGIFGIQGVVTPGSEFAMLLGLPNGAILPVKLEWNCLGWQSMVLLGLTFATGLAGNFTKFSKLQVVILGILGTFLVNIFRMTAITALMYFWNEVAAQVMHDYLAMFAALAWMIFFWWFVYNFVLETKIENKNV